MPIGCMMTYRSRLQLPVSAPASSVPIFCNDAEELLLPDLALSLARAEQAHLPSRYGFRVRASVQLQILGGETRDIPSDGTPHKLTLDLNGRLVAKLAFWVSSEQDCHLRLTNRDSKGAVTVLVPDHRLNDSRPFVVLAHHPPVRVPPESEQPPPPKRRRRSVSLATGSEHERRRGTKSYAIGVTNGAIYEARCSLPLLRLQVGRWLVCAPVDPMLQDFELDFSPRPAVLDGSSEHATPIRDPERTHSLCTILQPACSVKKQVRLRLYVRSQREDKVASASNSTVTNRGLRAATFWDQPG